MKFAAIPEQQWFNFVVPVRQDSELRSAVSRGSSDAQVNAVTARHLEAAELASAEWDSAISGLKEQQTRNFRAMLRDGQVAGHAQ